MTKTYKQDKGVAGLTILLSVMVMLFIIGLITMIFSLMSSEMRNATFTTTSVAVSNETGAWLNETTYLVDNSGANDFANLVITSAINSTDNSSIGIGNFTIDGAGFTNASTTTWTSVWVSYTYDYGAENTATQVMNDTSSGIAGVTDWFDIFVVITAMVVLILLVVIIITAIRSSGMIAGGETSGANQVGTA